MKNKVILWIMMVFGLSMLVGCNTLHNMIYKDYSKKTDVQQEIRSLENKHRDDVSAKVKDVQSKLENTIKVQDGQLQEGANKLYGANETFKYYTQPTRLDIMINNRVAEAWAAMGKYPSYQTIQLENERIRKELDEKTTSLGQLMKEHDRIMSENKSLAESSDKSKKEVEVAKQELLGINSKYQSESTQLQSKLNEVNDKIQQKQQEVVNNKEAVERMKTKLMIGCGIAAALCIIGAVYSPVGKGSLAMCAAVFGGAATAMPYIEGWMIMVVVLIIAAIISVVFLYKHHIADKTTDNLINHIQDIKENPDIPDNVKNIIKESLTQWNGKYVGDKNTHADGAVEKYIKSKLKDYGRL